MCSVLVIGARNSGKTSFVNFLKTSLRLPPSKRANRGHEIDTPPPLARHNPNFLSHYQEIEMDDERIGLTLWDSQGLDKSIIDLQLPELSMFVESKFSDTFVEESKVVRAPGVRDTHIHCVFLVLDPVGLDANLKAAQEAKTKNEDASKHQIKKPAPIIGALDVDFELQVLKTLRGKTTVVPIISKADTITTAHMAFLKKTVGDSLRKAGLNPWEALDLESDEQDDDRLDEGDEDEDSAGEHAADSSSGSLKSDDSDTLPREAPRSNMKRQMAHKRVSSALSLSNTTLDDGYVPLSILSPDEYSLDPKNGPVGRLFPWGFADPHNLDHCDFVKLKEACFGEWRAELREASREIFYEKWRTNRLNGLGSVNGAHRTPEPRRSSGATSTNLNRSKNR